MFGISGEHLLVLLVILLIFGPRRLPDLGNSLGRAMKGFKDAMNGKDQEVASEAPVKKEAAKPQQIPEESVQHAAPRETAHQPETRI